MMRRLYEKRQQLNEQLFGLLQPPPPDNPEYQDELCEVHPSHTPCGVLIHILVELGTTFEREARTCNSIETPLTVCTETQ